MAGGVWVAGFRALGLRGMMVLFSVSGELPVLGLDVSELCIETIGLERA